MIFNRTFFNFTLGFMTILLVAFIATLAVNFVDQKNVEEAVELEAETREPTT